MALIVGKFHMYILSPNSLDIRGTAIIVESFNLYILSLNSLGVRQMALIVRSLKHVRTFTELTGYTTDGINLQEASTCTYFHQTRLTWQVALIKMGR
jgi:hypothetical protein